MGAVKVMVVDDSPFSRTILRDSLQELGYEVVGEADSIASLIQTYDRCKPDIVTMDISMPGADGFECTRVLRRHDPAARIVLVSSMKDDGTEAEARKVGVVGYVQKPVDGEVLNRVIKHAIAPDEVFEVLDARCLETFKEAAVHTITRMTKTKVEFPAVQASEGAHVSQGITVIVGIIGRFSGTLILDISAESARKMTAAILRREPKDHDEVLGMVGELANVVGGVACSMLNKKERSLGLMVAPPSVFFGAPATIVSPYINARSAYAETDFGSLYISVGFKKGSVLWM